MYSRLFCYDIWVWILIQHRHSQSALRALDLGAKFQIVAIRILRETEGLKEVRGTTKGTFRYYHFINDLHMYETTTSLS